MDRKKLVKDVYNSIASKYDKKRQDPKDSSWNIYLEEPAIETLLKPLVVNKTVLDLGCGTGILTDKLCNWNAKPHGVDQSEKMIEIAQRNLPNVNFIIGCADNLPYNAGVFDIVASSLMIHYIKNLVPVFKEAYRVLQKGGHFIFSMHHPFQESFKTDKSGQDGFPVFQPYFHNNEYYWKMCDTQFLSFHHTFENIIQSLRKAGFCVYNLIECRPADTARNEFDDFELTSKYPTFCVFHAAKI